MTPATVKVRGVKEQTSKLKFTFLQNCTFSISIYLVKDVNLVVGQVEGDHTAQGTESALLHLDNVAALQVEVSEVGSEDEGSPGQLLQVVIPQVEFHCYL